MRIDRCEMQTLPLAGAELVRICFCGNGKDSEAIIEVRGAREATIPLSGAAMDLTFAGPIKMSTRSYGDSAVVIEIAPTPEQPMMLDEIAVLFFGSDDEWAECLRHYTEAGNLFWCVERLQLSARPIVKVQKTVVDDAQAACPMNQWAKVPVAGKIKLLAKHGAGAKQIVDAHTPRHLTAKEFTPQNHRRCGDGSSEALLRSDPPATWPTA
jgi:hypothetical protein